MDSRGAFHIEPSRIEPLAGAQAYKTYSVRAPLATHWRKATCEEYECDDFIYGFVTTIDANTELGRKQHYFLTHDKTRKASAQNIGDGLWKFVYSPGNKCMKFYEHRVPIGRPPLLLVTGGDWRGNPMHVPTIKHRSIENWVEDCATHQDRLSTAHKRG
jgi:hypothetical protein